MTQAKKSVKNGTNNNNVSIDTAIQEAVKPAPLSDLAPTKDITKAQLVKALNSFSIDVPEWDSKHKDSFISVLNGELISSQLCELASLGSFLERRKITLLNKEGKVFDFKEVFKTSTILQDSKEVKKAGLKFGVAKSRFYKTFLAKYSLVFASIARGVKETETDKMDGIDGKEGKQILSFLSLLHKQGYKYK